MARSGGNRRKLAETFLSDRGPGGPLMVFAGSAQLQLRVFVDHNAHERHWSGALPAMSGPGGPRSGKTLGCQHAAHQMALARRPKVGRGCRAIGPHELAA